MNLRLERNIVDFSATCDERDMDYELDEFEIDVDGVSVGLFFGSAWLESDGKSGFYVHRIALAGRRAKTKKTAIGGVKTYYLDAVLALDRKSEDPFSRVLFERIAEQLENNAEIQLLYNERQSAA